MINEQITPVRQELSSGTRMHIAEETIHAGRLAVKGLLAEEPINYGSISEHRLIINAARRDVTEMARILRSQSDGLPRKYNGWQKTWPN